MRSLALTQTAEQLPQLQPTLPFPAGLPLPLPLALAAPSSRRPP